MEREHLGIQKTLFKVVAVSCFIGVFGAFATSQVYALGWETLSLKNVVDILIGVVGGTLIPVAILVVFLVFVVGIVRYLHIANAGSKSMVEEAKGRLLYPVLAIFILFTLWGFIEIVRLIFTR